MYLKYHLNNSGEGLGVKASFARFHTQTPHFFEKLLFKMEVKGLDETDGYSYLLYIPEKYQAQTNAIGTLWVEPLSGIVVNYQDQGASSWIDINDRKDIEEFNTWINTYTPETRLAQLALARTTRLRMLLMEVYLPALLLSSSLVCFFAGWFMSSRTSRIADTA